MHVTTRMKCTGSITCSLFPKSIISTFVKRSIQKYMHKCNTCTNKRPMGHIAHLRKQFKSINTYDYMITLIKSRKNTLLILGELIGSSFEQT